MFNAYPEKKILRYSKQEKKGLMLLLSLCPQLIKHLEAHMGGVDLADMLVALY